MVLDHSIIQAEVQWFQLLPPRFQSKSIGTNYDEAELQSSNESLERLFVLSSFRKDIPDRVQELLHSFFCEGEPQAKPDNSV